MANAAKNKGDKGERDAVVALIQRTPHLLVQDRRPMRALGAGRKDDEGDLRVLPGTSIQVKFWNNLTRACREAADGAVRQAKNAQNPYAMGLVPIPRANTAVGSLRWLAAGYSWPGGIDQWEPVPTFGGAQIAVKHLQSGFGGRVPLSLRMTRVKAKGSKTLYIAPVEAWLESYAVDTGQPFHAPADYVTPAIWEDDPELAVELGGDVSQLLAPVS
ncbi:hypothetical protein [Ornithinimicrobium murale]|uniref:hypothetical protein n=1 Tax=Ornithinimicrobium murale TaxID=1050153 RepID=UPI000E0D37F4|nr:hypothetical protein [Ornithinimicrobium murale]